MPRVKHVFQRMNKDASPLALKAGEVREMLNVQVHPTYVTNVPATTPVLPAVVAGEKVIGSYEDKQHDQVIAWIFSESGADRIVKHTPGDAPTETILEWDGFGWTADTNITGAGVIDDLLFWCDGGAEIKQINMTRKALYDSIKATDADFANLIKRPPLLPITAARLTEAESTEANLIYNNYFRFTYQFVYEDNQRSVFAPFSQVVTYDAQDSNPDTIRSTRRRIKLEIDGSTSNINKSVKAINIAVQRGSDATLYIIKKINVPTEGQEVYEYYFDNSTTGIAVGEDEATRLFDAIPLHPKALAIARNRVFIGNYKDGYNGFGSGDLTITPHYTNLDELKSGDPSSPFPLFLWKGNSRSRFGIEYVDFAGRSMGVYHQDDWQFNTIDYPKHLVGTDDILIDFVTIGLNLTPPAWAKGWHLVRDKGNYDFFVSATGAIVNEVEVGSTLVKLQYLPPFGSISRMFIDIRNLVKKDMGYVYSEGDTVSVSYVYGIADSTITETSATLHTINDIPIIGQEGNLIQIPVTRALLNNFLGGNNEQRPDFRFGVHFEIARKLQTAENVFYRTGHSGIIEEGSIVESLVLKGDTVYSHIFQPPNRDHLTLSIEVGTAVGKDVHKAAIEAGNILHVYTDSIIGESTGEVNYGRVDLDYPTDNYYYNYFNFNEAMSPWRQKYGDWPRSLGQSVLLLDEILSREVNKPNFVRFSNKYLSGTQINGLNSFEALNEKELPMENGPINKLQLASNNQAEGSVLLAVMQNETESQYLGEVQWRDTQGRTTSAISDAVIGSTNTLRGGYGTINPESVVQEGGRVWFWDAVKGEPVRYSADGLTPLATTGFMRDFFREVSQKQLALGNQVKVYGGFDPKMKEYIMTFSGIDGFFDGFTIAYSEIIEGFTTFYSFQPERYAKCNTHFFSFLSGQIHQHHLGEATNTFYGTHYPSKIRFVPNAEPSLVKIWQAVIVEGQELWVPVELANEKGQESLMKAAWFENREGIYYGAIRRDKNSTGFVFISDPAEKAIRAINNGQPMRSQYLEIEIENNSPSLVRLDAASVEFIPSSGHQPF